MFLKADTQTIVTIGPFVDVGDGFTPETGVALSTADEAELIKHGSTSVVDISGATWAAVTNCDGYYSLTLTASHTDTEGQLTIVVQDDSVCLPVLARFTVVNANVYDSLFAAAATDYLQVDTLQLGGATQSATDLKDFADAGYDPATNKVEGVKLVDTTTNNTDMVGTDGANTTTPPTAAAIRAEIDNNSTQLADIVADTNELQTDDVPALIANLDTVVDRVEADTQDIQNRLPAALISGKMDSDAVAISGSTDAADKLEEHATSVVLGTASGTPTTTVIAASDLPSSTNDFYNGRIIVFTSGSLAGQATDITDYNGGTKEMTVTALTSAPSASDTFVVV